MPHDPRDGFESFDEAQFYGEEPPANDRPLAPLSFLCAAIRAQIDDLDKWNSVPVYSPHAQQKMGRIRELCSEIERHATENPDV